MRRCASHACRALPIVDFSSFTNVAQEHSSIASERAATALQLRSVLRDVGFFYATGHGVDMRLCNTVLAEARGFFVETPQAEKEDISIHKAASGARGYQRVGQNITQMQQDQHEALDLMRELPAHHHLRQRSACSKHHMESFALANLPHGDFNQWPCAQRNPCLRPAVEKYISQMLNLGDAVMRCIALSLGLPEPFFRSFTDDSFWNCRLIHYPARDGDRNSAVEGDGCGEHTDYGFLTMVHSDEVPCTRVNRACLQICDVDGQWVDVPPVTDAFVMNIGDMLAAITNGAYRSTPHRVRAPIMPQPARVSAPFFFEPAYDAVCAPLQDIDFSACGLFPSDASSTFNSVIYGDHLYSKTSTNFVV
mmetsp:Transcript_27706/g.54388  ORF Transcript_27706/g.54388 Transcript_27706/m.54388 type:complete len:364 (+) Transcript_27706:52-1143(+)